MSDRTDQLTAALNDLSAAVSAAVTKLGDHSDDLVAARLAEDDAAIDGAIAGIRGQVDALKASVPAPPAVPAP